jgi:hypothetical protein
MAGVKIEFNNTDDKPGKRNASQQSRGMTLRGICVIPLHGQPWRVVALAVAKDPAVVR